MPSSTRAPPVVVVVNRVRSGPLGIDAQADRMRALKRSAGGADVVFLPFDQRAADAALLHARPMTDVAPRSALRCRRETTGDGAPCPAEAETAAGPLGFEEVPSRSTASLSARGSGSVTSRRWSGVAQLKPVP